MKPTVPSHVHIDDLQAVLDAELPKLSPAPSDSAKGFLEVVLYWVMEWATLHQSADFSDFAPFVIMLDDGVAEEAGWEIRDFFKEEQPLNLGGMMIASSAALFAVRAMSTTADSLKDLGKQVVHHGFEHCPSLVVDPSKGQVILCFEGIRKPRVKLALMSPPIIHIDESTIDAALSEFERDYTRYPDGYAHCWFDRPGRVMLREAEAIVRDNLFIFLKLKTFKSQHVAREELLPVGRPDISILDRQANRTACIFELKVLRSRGMPKNPGQGRGVKPYTLEKNTRHARQGVRQAQKYKEASVCPTAFLCCFDGRDTSETLTTVKQLAIEHGILYRQYYMETSTRDDLG